MNSPTPSSTTDSEAPVEAGTPRSVTSENTSHSGRSSRSGGSSRSGRESEKRSNVSSDVSSSDEEEEASETGGLNNKSPESGAGGGANNSIEDEEDEGGFYVEPDPDRPVPKKYNPIEQFVREKLLKEWGQFGKRTTFDVSAEFKERYRIKRDRERVTELRRKKELKERKQAEDVQWRKDNFAQKQFLREQKAFFDARRKASKEEAQHRRNVNWKRVNNRETVGRVTAEAALARRIQQEKDDENNRQEALRQAMARAQAKAVKDAKDKTQHEADEDEFCDNLARKFGVYEGVPRYAPPASLPDLPPKQSTHVRIGWIEGEGAPDSDLESEPDDDEEEFGGIDGRLTCDLTGYAYCEIITGQNLGQPGAKALAKVLTPVRKGGHHQASEGGDAEFEPGACEPATKLILRNNKLLLHGTRYIARALVSGALPALQVLDLAGNKIGDTGGAICWRGHCGAQMLATIEKARPSIQCDW